MFNVNDIVVCKEEASLFYGITNSDAILMVMKVPDDTDNHYHTKCIRHSKQDDFVGSDHQFERETFEEDFQSVDESVANDIRDEALITKDWRLNSGEHYNYVMAIKVKNLFSRYIRNIYTAMNEFPCYEAYRLIRTMYNNIHPSRFEELYNSTPYSIHGYDVTCENLEEIFNTLTMYQKEGAFTEIFVSTPTSVLNAFGDIMDEKLGETYEINYIPYASEGFSNTHKIIALENKNNGLMFYITNYATADVFMYTAVWYMESHDIFMSDDMKNALLNSDKKAFIYAANVVFSTYELCCAELKRKKMIREFTEAYGDALTRPLQEKIEYIQREINSYQRELEQLYVKQRERRMQLLFYSNASENDEFINFIKTYGSNIITAKVEGTTFIFDVLTYMTYWNEEDYDTVRQNDARFRRLPDYIKQLLDDIFLTRTVRLKIEQKFGLNLDECNAYYNDSVRFRSEYGEGGHGMPNPHITRYSCFGTHKTTITKLLAEMNILQAYNQTVAACSGLTWTDGAVTNEFFNYLVSRYIDVKCLEFADGSVLTVNEYRQKYEDEGRTYTQ